MVFKRLREEKRKGLVGYLTAGYPDMKSSLKNFQIAIKAGVDILEIGVPFSDPTADGPVIQAASHKALEGHCNVSGVLELVRKLRKTSDVPVVLFGYANPFFRYGYSELSRDAAEAGVDGFLVVDMPHEEADEFRTAAGRYGLDWIVLVAPTTARGREKLLLKNAGGFVYYITVTGVTSTRTLVPRDVAGHVKELKKLTALPVAAGFGISNGRQAKQVAKSADAVVVGSSLIKAVNEGRLAQLVSEIRRALDRR